MNNRPTIIHDFFRRLSGLALVVAACVWLVQPLAGQEASVCTVVKLDLGQKAALEREAFNAHLTLTNNQSDAALSNLRVSVIIKDPLGQPADSLFFTKVTDLKSVSAIDGNGTVQPATMADITWLIIPSTGAGGTAASGKVYSVTAQISYVSGGVPNVNATLPANITVFPQPLLNLEYVLPFEIFSVDPFTLTGATEPFPLGLRVTNVGAGTAVNFKIASGQPNIADNKQGLPVTFQILGTFVDSKALPDNTLTIPFGNIAPGGSIQAAWEMAASFSGRFTNFTVTLTHAAELGGALTSLIQNAVTYTLIKDVFNEQPGHDTQFDMLLNTGTPRGEIEALYQNGQAPPADALMDSDRQGLTPVIELPGEIAGELSGSNGVLQFAFTVPVPSNTWVHSSLPAPLDGGMPLVSVTRSDGKIITPRNAWIGKHFDKLDLKLKYRLHILDFTGSQPLTYAMTFNAASVDVPPAPIADLVATPLNTGAFALGWTGTGEDGTTGTIYNGRYSIFYSTDLTAVPSLGAAAVVFSTTTAPGEPKSLLLDGLLGNATYQMALWLADAMGHYSDISTATVFTYARSGKNALAQNITNSSFNLAWDISSNMPGAEYGLRLATSPDNVLLETGYSRDISNYGFSELMVNTTYFVSLRAKDLMLRESAYSEIGGIVTLANPPAVSTGTINSVYLSSFTVAWGANGNPERTEYIVRISTMPDWSVPAGESGWFKAVEYSFNGLTDRNFILRASQGQELGRGGNRVRELRHSAYKNLGLPAACNQYGFSNAQFWR